MTKRLTILLVIMAFLAGALTYKLGQKVLIRKIFGYNYPASCTYRPREQMPQKCAAQPTAYVDPVEAFIPLLPVTPPRSLPTALVIIKKIGGGNADIVSVGGIFNNQEKTLFTSESVKPAADAATRRDFPDYDPIGGPHYSGGCFSDVSASPDRTKIIFGTSCFPGAMALPWTGLYNVSAATTTFVSRGGGERFLWSRDNSAVGYIVPVEGRGGEAMALTVLKPTLKTVELDAWNPREPVTIAFLGWHNDGSLLVYARVGDIGSSPGIKVTYILKRNGETQRIDGWLDD